jgi:hypothetical protein
MTTTEINTAISTAKCCLGDITCRIAQKAMYGQGYTKTTLVGLELSLYIFSLESYLLWSSEDCVEASDIEKMIHKVNKICGCDCTTAQSSTQVAQHTLADHTTLNHTL